MFVDYYSQISKVYRVILCKCPTASESDWFKFTSAFEMVYAHRHGVAKLGIEAGYILCIASFSQNCAKSYSCVEILHNIIIFCIVHILDTISF